MAVADVFDALTSQRPYKKAWALEDAASFLHDGAGSHFDPACVDAFLKRWDGAIAIRCRFQGRRPVLLNFSPGCAWDGAAFAATMRSGLDRLIGGSVRRGYRETR